MEFGKASVVGNAVHSLYADQVKPYGRILRKRIAEQALELTTALGLGEMDIDPFCSTPNLRAMQLAQCDRGG